MIFSNCTLKKISPTCLIAAVRWLYVERALHGRRMCVSGADHSFRALATRCAFVGFLTCALCMRSVCALYTSSALATRFAYVVNTLASPAFWQTLVAQRRTGLIFHFSLIFYARIVRRVYYVTGLLLYAT